MFTRRIELRPLKTGTYQVLNDADLYLLSSTEPEGPVKCASHDAYHGEQLPEGRPHGPFEVSCGGFSSLKAGLVEVLRSQSLTTALQSCFPGH